MVGMGGGWLAVAPPPPVPRGSLGGGAGVSGMMAPLGLPLRQLTA